MLPKYYDGDKAIAKFVVVAIFDDKFKEIISGSGLFGKISELLRDIALTVELYSYFEVWPSEETRQFCFIIKDAYEKNFGHDAHWQGYFGSE